MAEAALDKNTAEVMGTERTNMPSVQRASALGEVSGDISASDIRLPRLQITYGVGGLAEAFAPGDWILDKENLLAHKDEPLRVVILSAVKYWKEYLSNEAFNAGVRPRSFATDTEVLKNGGTVEWVNGVGPTFSPAMDVKLLIEKPANLVCGYFGLEIEGKSYAPAIWTADKTTYNKVAQVITLMSRFTLASRGLCSGLFELSTTVQKNQKGRVIPYPNIRLVGNNSDGFLQVLETLFNRPMGGTEPKQIGN